MASRKVAIAVAKGDGIGPEIMDAALHIFEAAKVPLQYKFVEMGNKFYKNGFSTGMTPEAKHTVEQTRILFKGPMETPKGLGVKSINVTSRKVWSTFANKRVFQSLPGVETVFSKAGIPVDLTIFRENIEDTYGGIEHYQSHDVAQCRRLITRIGSEQIIRAAFDSARSKLNNPRVTCCHKANIMKLTDGLFLETFYRIAKEYPDIKADDAIVDDLAMKLVTRPDKFSIVVLPNLQGDIMSDLCAGLVGGLGMAPSANIGDYISIFEAVHGTAPDITGKGLANPTALLMSGLMMLRHLGMHDRSISIEKALKATLAQGVRTGDLMQLPGVKASSTKDFAEAVVKNIPEEAKQEFFDVKYFQHLEKPSPKENEMLLSPRTISKESTVGVDIFVDSSLSPSELAKVINGVVEGKKVKLIMLSNRGTQVWPTGSVFTQLVNHFRCRLESVDESKPLSETELLGIVGDVSKKLRVCSLEMLRVIDGIRKFSLAQGQ